MFRIGDVVMTKEGFDRGLVVKVDESGQPLEIMSCPDRIYRRSRTNRYRAKGKGYYIMEPNYYGGIHSVKWYKTGERFTIDMWMKKYEDPGNYYRDVQRQINTVKAKKRNPIYKIGKYLKKDDQ